MLRSALVLAALAASPAAAEPIEHAARLTLGPVWDENPGRDAAANFPEASAGMAAVLSVDASHRGPSHATAFSLDAGARGFTTRKAAEEDSELATVLSLSHSVILEGVAPFVAGTAKDLRAKAGLFDYSDGALRAGVALGPLGPLTPRVYGGIERFLYRPDVRGHAFTAGLVGASVHADLGRGHGLDAGWDGSFRTYQVGAFAAQIFSVDWSYRGAVLLGAGYQLALTKDDPVLGTNRHRFQARAGIPLPGRLVLTADAALFLATLPPASSNVQAATDNVSSLGAQLTLPVAGAVSLQGSFRWYASVGQSTTYDRKLAGLAAAIDF